jgi:Skp family chaperone for outer membrane proteins
MKQNRKDNGFFKAWSAVVYTAAFVALLSTVDVTPVRAADCKVGIIDTAVIVLKSKYGQKMRAEFAEELEDQRKVLDKKRSEAEKQRDKLLEAKKDGKSDKKIKELEDELQKSIRELKWMKEDLDKDLTEMDKELQERMKQRVRIVLDQFVAGTDYCIILQKNRVAAFSDSVDISEEFVKWLDSYKE